MESNAAKIIFECKECAGMGDLSDPGCFEEVIAALRSEFNVDSIVFSNYTETNYHGAVMEVLKRISGILNDVQRFAGRTPWNEIQVDGNVKPQARKKICSQCPRNPVAIFSVIERKGKKSIEYLCRSVNHYLPFLEAFPFDARCTACIQNTKSDVQYIMEKLEDLRRFVLYHGFKVVEAEA
jgi:hypothetical protein